MSIQKQTAEKKALIKSLRKVARKKSWGELSRLTGMGRGWLWRVLDAENANPSLEMLIRLTNALGMKLELKEK